MLQWNLVVVQQEDFTHAPAEPYQTNWGPRYEIKPLTTSKLWEFFLNFFSVRSYILVVLSIGICAVNSK